MIRRSRLAAGLSLVLFWNNCALAHQVESNIWAERKQASTPATLPRLDALPITANLVPERNFRSLIQSISRNHGVVQEVYESDRKDAPSLVLLQDVHMQQEAQSNLAAMLQNLINQKKIGLVGLEGAFEPLDFSPYRAGLDPAVVKKVARSFFRQNKLAAASYVGITGPVPPPFVGIDDQLHYDKNVQAYLDSLALREPAEASLKQRRAELTATRDSILSPQLQAYERLHRSYLQGDLGLGTYLNKLSELAGSDVPDSVITHFLEAVRLESTLDFNRVESERKRVLEKLTGRLSNAELSQLLSQSLSNRLGQTGFGPLYQNVQELCAAKGISLATTPAFAAYLRYVALAEKVNSDQLLSAISRWEERLADRLTITAEEKAWMAESDRVSYAGKLLRFELTPAEWEKYKQGNPTPGTSPDGEGNKIGGRLASFERFYEQADIRSRKMVENLLRQSSILKSQTLNQSMSLVVGGFHTPEITRLLRAQKISYVVVSPKITKLDEEAGSSYLSAFAVEKTPLDRLMMGEKLFLKPRTEVDSTVGVKISASTLARMVPWINDTVAKVKVAHKKVFMDLVVRKAFDPADDVFNLKREYAIAFKELIYQLPIFLVVYFSPGSLSSPLQLTLLILLDIALAVRFALDHNNNPLRPLTGGQMVLLGVVGAALGGIFLIPGLVEACGWQSILVVVEAHFLVYNLSVRGIKAWAKRSGMETKAPTFVRFAQWLPYASIDMPQKKPTLESLGIALLTAYKMVHYIKKAGIRFILIPGVEAPLTKAFLRAAWINLYGDAELPVFLWIEPRSLGKLSGVTSQETAEEILGENFPDVLRDEQAAALFSELPIISIFPTDGSRAMAIAVEKTFEYLGAQNFSTGYLLALDGAENGGIKDPVIGTYDSGAAYGLFELSTMLQYVEFDDEEEAMFHFTMLEEQLGIMAEAMGIPDDFIPESIRDRGGPFGPLEIAPSTELEDEFPEILKKDGYRLVRAYSRGGSSGKTFLAENSDGVRVVVKYADWEGVSGNGVPWLVRQAARLREIQETYPPEARSLYPRVADFKQEGEVAYYAMEYFPDAIDITQYYFFDPFISERDVYESVDAFLSLMAETHYQHHLEPHPDELRKNFIDRMKYRLELLMRHEGEVYDHLVKGRRFELGDASYDDASYFFEDVATRPQVLINGRVYPNLPVLLRILEGQAEALLAQMGPTHYSKLAHGDIPLRNVLRLNTGEVRIIDIRAQNIHPTSPSRTSVEYDLAKIAHGFFLEMVRNDYFHVGIRNMGPEFSFAYGFFNYPGNHRYQYMVEKFAEMLERNEDLNRLLSGHGTDWRAYVQLGEFINYASDAIHRFTQDPTGRHGLMYYLRAVEGIYRFLKQRDMIPEDVLTAGTIPLTTFKARGKKRVVETLAKRWLQQPGLFLVGINGGSSSGKSFFAHEITRAVAAAGRPTVNVQVQTEGETDFKLSEQQFIALDWFLKDRATRKPLVEAIEAGRMPLSDYQKKAWDRDSFHGLMKMIKDHFESTPDKPFSVTIPGCYSRDTGLNDTRIRLAIKPGAVVVAEGVGIDEESFDDSVFVDNRDDEGFIQTSLEREKKKDPKKRVRPEVIRYRMETVDIPISHALRFSAANSSSHIIDNTNHRWPVLGQIFFKGDFTGTLYSLFLETFQAGRYGAMNIHEAWEHYRKYDAHRLENWAYLSAGLSRVWLWTLAFSIASFYLAAGAVTPREMGYLLLPLSFAILHAFIWFGFFMDHILEWRQAGKRTEVRGPPSWRNVVAAFLIASINAAAGFLPYSAVSTALNYPVDSLFIIGILIGAVVLVVTIGFAVHGTVNETGRRLSARLNRQAEAELEDAVVEWISTIGAAAMARDLGQLTGSPSLELADHLTVKNNFESQALAYIAAHVSDHRFRGRLETAIGEKLAAAGSHIAPFDVEHQSRLAARFLLAYVVAAQRGIAPDFNGEAAFVFSSVEEELSPEENELQRVAMLSSFIQYGGATGAHQNIFVDQHTGVNAAAAVRTLHQLGWFPRTKFHMQKAGSYEDIQSSVGAPSVLVHSPDFRGETIPSTIQPVNFEEQFVAPIRRLGLMQMLKFFQAALIAA